MVICMDLLWDWLVLMLLVADGACKREGWWFILLCVPSAMQFISINFWGNPEVSLKWKLFSGQNKSMQCWAFQPDYLSYGKQIKFLCSAIVFQVLLEGEVFFLFGAHLCMCPQIYFTGVVRCDSRIVLYVFRIRTYIKLTNSEAVTIIHTAGWKTADCSVLDTFSRDWTTLTSWNCSVHTVKITFSLILWIWD